MRLTVSDFHCDALSKLQMNPKLNFASSRKLDVNLQRMKQGGVRLQCFAIYLSEKLGTPRYGYVQEQIDLFYHHIASLGVRPIGFVEDLEELEQSQGIGGLLSIEGADGLEGNLDHVRECYERGVRILGLTWNYANWAADGILEPRNGGLTPAGRDLVKLCHELGMILDVSHLSVRGFWELQELAAASRRPFIASHSNAFRVCDHVRNLRDDQIEALISLGGRIGLTFVPWFVKKGRNPSSEDLLPHIEHVCALGGADHIMFGSDFDGIESHLRNLRHAGDYAKFQEMLLKHYPEGLVRGWLSGHAAAFLRDWLPFRKKAL